MDGKKRREANVGSSAIGVVMDGDEAIEYKYKRYGRE